MTSKIKSQNKKELILDAALKVISREGLRGLTYRAVAKEAGVPLGLTTYYFKGIESLYVEAYQRFAMHSGMQLEGLVKEGTVLLDAYHQEPGGNKKIAVKKLMKAVSVLVSDYVYVRVKKEREYRLMETAFIHAALTNPEINSTVRESEMRFNAAAEDWFTAFGSSDPELMASMLIGIIKHAENRCMLGMNGAQDKGFLDKTLSGFFRHVLNDTG